MMKIKSQKKTLKYSYDVIVIGAGVSGVCSSIYLKKAGINFLLIEKDIPGGVLNKISKIENYPGFIEKDGPTLAYNLFMQLKENDISILKEDVVNINKKEDNFYEVYTNKNIYVCKKIIIATGKVPKKLGIKNEDEYIGKGISYCALCDGALYKQKDIIVVGGGKSSIEACKYLSNIVNKIYLINKGICLKVTSDEFSMIKKLENVEIINETSIKELIIEKDNVTGVILDNDNKIKSSAIFVCIGNTLNSNYYQNLKLEIDKLGIVVNNKMQTSDKNIYAIGDSISKGLYQVSTAVSEGAIAAVNLIKELK